MSTKIYDDHKEGIIRFLSHRGFTKEQLVIALDVISTFKMMESQDEYFSIPFACWAKLEQLQDFLKLMTGVDADDVSDEIAIAYHKHSQNDQTNN